MPELSITCGVCKSVVNVGGTFISKIAGQTRPCPVCDSPLTFPASDLPPPPAAKPFTPGKPVRLTCPQCAAQFTLSYDTVSKMAGTPLKCLKCEADIPLPIPGSPLSSATPASSSTAISGPTHRKCSGCLSPIHGDVTFCPVCGTRLDDFKSATPSGNGPHLKVQTEEEPPPPIPCVKCKRMIDCETVICPHCKTNQTSGRRNKPDSRPVGWDRDPIQHSKVGKLAHKIGIAFFAIILLGLLSVGAIWFYKFILSQMPES